MKSFFTVVVLLILTVDCTQVCSCGPQPRAVFYFFYKSATNPDLLQPQTGLYTTSDIKIYEVINTNGTVAQSPAPAFNGQYVFDNDSKQSGYFIDYQSSIFQYQNSLQKTLIQLHQGVTDTLTYTFIPSSSYPQQVFYNSKPVWKLGDSMEITIVK